MDKAFVHHVVIRQSRSRLIDNNDIEPFKLVLVLPKSLSCRPLDAVSGRCLATLFF